jgi:hypothetical protein
MVILRLVMAGDSRRWTLCRYSSSAMFISEMTGLEFEGPNGQIVTGESQIEGHQLDNDLSIAANIGILVGMLVFIRLAALVGLKLAYHRNWL